MICPSQHWRSLIGGKTSSVHIGQLVVNCFFPGTVCRLKPWRSSVSSFLSLRSSFTPCFSSFSPSVALLSFWISFLCSTASTCNISSLQSLLQPASQAPAFSHLLCQELQVCLKDEGAIIAQELAVFQLTVGASPSVPT